MDRVPAAIAETGIAGPWVAADEADAVADAKGAYALLLRLETPTEIRLRHADPVRLDPGWFVYCGSAKGPGGLRARLKRHFRQDKSRHWHIDNLTIGAAELAALPVPDGDECALVSTLLQSPAFDIAVPGFGNTDCRRCASHLLRFRDDKA